MELVSRRGVIYYCKNCGEGYVKDGRPPKGFICPFCKSYNYLYNRKWKAKRTGES